MQAYADYMTVMMTLWHPPVYICPNAMPPVQPDDGVDNLMAGLASMHVDTPTDMDLDPFEPHLDNQ